LEENASNSWFESWRKAICDGLSTLCRKYQAPEPSPEPVEEEPAPAPPSAGTVIHPYSKSINKVFAGELEVTTKPYLCLKLVRQIIEDANGWPSHELYRKYLTTKVDENNTSTPWARDFEASMYELGYVVDRAPREGDIVFMSHAAWPYGHVGVMFTDELVFENTPSERGFMGPGALRLVHIKEWGKPTTVARL